MRSGAFYLLSQHPEVEGKLHDELAPVLAGHTPRYEDLAEAAPHAHGERRPAHVIARQPVGDDEVLQVTKS